MRRPQSTFDAKNLVLRLAAGNAVASGKRRSIGFAGLVVELILKIALARVVPAKPMAILLLGASGMLVAGLCDGAEARVALWPAAAEALADPGTSGPSDSGTDEAPREDEPEAGTDQPSEAPQDGQEGPQDGFGCPVREPGPYPLLI